MKRLTADLKPRFMSDKINRGFLLRICVWKGWSQILIKDLLVTRSVADFQWGSAVNRLNMVLIDQEAVAQMWLWGCKSCSGCPDVDLRRIKATEEPDRRSVLHGISWCNNYQCSFLFRMKNVIWFDSGLDEKFEL